MQTRLAPPEVPKGIPSKVFYLTTTDMPHYDQLLDPTKAEYFAKEKGEKGTIIWMTPDEALAKGAEIHGVSMEEELRIVSEEAISKYTELMKQGEKFPLPVLDYKRKDQEGRHRLLAAKKVGVVRVPVLIVEEVTEPTVKTPEAVRAKEEGSSSNPVGTCYPDAWRYVMRHIEGVLVHGTTISLGKRINHAWVELPDGTVWEPSSQAILPKERYYALVDPVVEHRYTADEAAHMLNVGKHGPWTEEERQRFLGGNPMPKTESERLSFHEIIFGKGSTPPLERLRRGQTLNDMLPMPMDSGPPLPRALGIRWPWK